jgi:hypothetical protein
MHWLLDNYCHHRTVGQAHHTANLDCIDHTPGPDFTAPYIDYHHSLDFVGNPVRHLQCILVFL